MAKLLTALLNSKLTGDGVDRKLVTAGRNVILPFLGTNGIESAGQVYPP